MAPRENAIFMPVPYPGMTVQDWNEAIYRHATLMWRDDQGKPIKQLIGWCLHCNTAWPVDWAYKYPCPYHCQKGVFTSGEPSLVKCSGYKCGEPIAEAFCSRIYSSLKALKQCQHLI